MSGEEIIQIGSLRKTWGNKGEIMAELSVHEVGDLLSEGFLFVEFDAQQVPFRYSSIRSTEKQGILIRFTDYDTPQTAALLQGRKLSAPRKAIVTEKEIPLTGHDLVGVEVHESVHGPIGHIIRMEGSKEQDVLVILNGVKEIMIPLVEEMIDGFDSDKRVLRMTTPPGLIDMYLG